MRIPTLADIEAAREALARRLRLHPDGGVPLALRAGRRTGADQGREPPAHRVVQDPRRLPADVAGSPTEEQAAGVVAASAGNHAQGVALAAQMLGIHATVFMPEGAPIPKEKATRGYGAEVRFHGHSIDEALVAAQAVRRPRPARC